MKLVSDLMVRNVLSLKASDSLQDAEQLMGKAQIRHVPILDDDGKVVGLLTQKEVLAEAFRITDRFGAHLLRTYLAKIRISEAMRTDVLTFSDQASLKEAGEALLAKRLGCILVTDHEKKLLGIISSKDFLRLALSNL